MRNKYKGSCYRCGFEVKPYQGHFEKVTENQLKKYGKAVINKKWLLQHSECAIKYRHTDFTTCTKGE
jgi:hypothetical protein